VTSERKITITASLGVAVSHETNSFDAETLLQMADGALYRAKELGRNRAELAIAPEHIGSQAVPAADSSIKA
jgi:diguanylate cyclase (GGDEF)-like protein